MNKFEKVIYLSKDKNCAGTANVESHYVVFAMSARIECY